VSFLGCVFRDFVFVFFVCVNSTVFFCWVSDASGRGFVLRFFFLGVCFFFGGSGGGVFGRVVCFWCGEACSGLKVELGWFYVVFVVGVVCVVVFLGDGCFLCFEGRGKGGFGLGSCC